MRGGLTAARGLLAATLALTACATGPPVAPAYTQGVPPDSTFSGFCEYSAPRFP